MGPVARRTIPFENSFDAQSTVSEDRVLTRSLRGVLRKREGSGFEPAKALVRGLPLPLPLALLESFSQLHLSLRDGRESRAL